MDEAIADQIKDSILAAFPIGSEWYDCQQDEIVTVALHFPPRGIVTVRRYTASHLPLLRPDQQDKTTIWDKLMRRRVIEPIDPNGEITTRDHTEIHRYSYSNLLDGRLITPAQTSEDARRLFEAYHTRGKQIYEDFVRIRAEAGFAKAEMWC